MEQAWLISRMTGDEALRHECLWRPVIERAIADADGRWTWGQLSEDVASGYVAVWVVSDESKVHGVFTTRIVQSAERWVLVEDLAGENLADWLNPANEVLEDWARSVGASQIMAEGRRGWERILKDIGYSVNRVQAVKRLNGMRGNPQTKYNSKHETRASLQISD